MNQKLTLQILSDLPPEAQKQALDFIAFLRTQYTPPRKQKTRKPNKLAKESFVGMWRNREDMKDSAAWVKNLRIQKKQIAPCEESLGQPRDSSSQRTLLGMTG